MIYIFKRGFLTKKEKGGYFEKNIEDENNEGLSQIPNELRYFCMDLIKEQLLKY